MLNQSCIDFAEALGSKAPIPGGGGASAYVALLGTALGSMVGNLTLGKKKYADVEEDIKAMLARSEALIEKFGELVEADGRAFAPLAKAYGLPSSTPEEKLIKDTVLQDALLGATEVPLEIARVCLESIYLHEEYARKGSRLAVSDAGCGVIFCKAALQGARLNVLINLAIMKDKTQKEIFERELEAITTLGMNKADEIYNYVEIAIQGDK